MLSKIPLSIAFFPLFITMIMADTCDIYFNSSVSPKDGPYSMIAGKCYTISAAVSSEQVSSAWINGIPSGSGYLRFFSDSSCANVITEGASPVDLHQGATINSVSVVSCT